MNKMINRPAVIIGFLVCVFLTTMIIEQAMAEDVIDASDPTKIYSYAGGGLKYTDYTNDEEMWEMRVTGNLGLSDQDMALFEIGYGWHSGDLEDGDDSEITNARVRWFHLFGMDYSVASGYRGWATQVDVQFAGNLKGTDGQNTMAFGGMFAFGVNEEISLYFPVNAISTWDKSFDHWNGFGIGIAPLITYSPDYLWNGAYFTLWPNYTRFISGDLSGEGAGNVDFSVGGTITPTVLWSITYQKNFDKDLNSYRRGRDTGLTNDQNIFISVTTYF